MPEIKVYYKRENAPSSSELDIQLVFYVNRDGEPQRAVGSLGKLLKKITFDRERRTPEDTIEANARRIIWKEYGLERVLFCEREPSDEVTGSRETEHYIFYRGRLNQEMLQHLVEQLASNGVEVMEKRNLADVVRQLPFYSGRYVPRF